MGLLVQADMATPVINDLGTKEQNEEFLTPAIHGEKIAALGVSEPNAGSDVAGIQTVGEEGRRRLRHQRRRRRTSRTARRADFVTLLAKTNPEAGAHGCSFFLVPTKTKGFRVSKKLKKIGNHSSDTAELALRGHAHPEALPPRRREHGVHVPDAELPERAHHRVRRARAPAAAIMIEEAIAYGRDRKAFGKPIIKREYWQHKFVDLTAKLEAAQGARLQGRRGVQRRASTSRRTPITLRDGEDHLAGEDLRRRRR